jgi:hypothetical protein
LPEIRKDIKEHKNTNKRGLVNIITCCPAIALSGTGVKYSACSNFGALLLASTTLTVTKHSEDMGGFPLSVAITVRTYWFSGEGSSAVCL